MRYTYSDILLKSLGYRSIGRSEFEALLKGAGHKYVRRVPTGKARPKYRYYYRNHHTRGAGVGNLDEIKQGSKFKLEHNGQSGHFHVVSEDGDKITIVHDETGHRTTTTKQELAELLRAEYGSEVKEQVKDKIDRAMATLREARKHGSKAHIRAAERRMTQLGVPVPPDKGGKDYKPLPKRRKVSASFEGKSQRRKGKKEWMRAAIMSGEKPTRSLGIYSLEHARGHWKVIKHGDTGSEVVGKVQASKGNKILGRGLMLMLHHHAPNGEPDKIKAVNSLHLGLNDLADVYNHSVVVSGLKKLGKAVDKANPKKEFTSSALPQSLEQALEGAQMWTARGRRASTTGLLAKNNRAYVSDGAGVRSVPFAGSPGKWDVRRLNGQPYYEQKTVAVETLENYLAIQHSHRGTVDARVLNRLASVANSLPGRWVVSIRFESGKIYAEAHPQERAGHSHAQLYRDAGGAKGRFVAEVGTAIGHPDWSTTVSPEQLERATHRRRVARLTKRSVGERAERVDDVVVFEHTDASRDAFMPLAPSTNQAKPPKQAQGAHDRREAETRDASEA